MFQFFSTIINCHNKYKTGRAFPFDQLCSRTADSSGKSKQVVTELLKIFILTCPDDLETKQIKKVNQVLAKYNRQAPDYDRMEKALKEALNKKKS